MRSSSEELRDAVDAASRTRSSGAERDESRGGYREGETSESHNPMDGSA
jgi:plasmid stabilization system protein ParE